MLTSDNLQESSAVNRLIRKQIKNLNVAWMENINSAT